MNKLAINGGIPIRNGLLPAQVTIGKEEKDAVESLMKKVVGNHQPLSGFRGNSSEAFYGGHYVRQFEDMFKNVFKKKDGWEAISVNSCTSALQLACGAIGLQPGDEVIVTPWSMSCSATAPIIYGATPVFADIEPLYFCLDPISIEQRITEKTKAIIVVDLFGQPFAEEILEIAKKHHLIIIEDAAQAIGSYYKNIPAGFLGHIGCFSFTQGKHLTAGEGGMAVSIDSEYKTNLQLLRNHAEAVISDMNNDMYTDVENMIGFNMRLTELQAVILMEQLKKLPEFVYRRQANAFYFMNELGKIPGITPAPIRTGCIHSFYVQAFFYNSDMMDGIHRDKFIQAVKAELKPQEGRVDLGVPIGCGYIKPLYKMPLFQNRKHWALKDHNYNAMPCPVAERLWKEDLFLWTLNGLDLNDQDRKDISDAFYKVFENREELI
ncbi:MAG: DegT/DnrJ/EryC1/StrS family aminotransferase [Melioribacteraceae bacterium]|jgi:dTDP-4-amino-4,6-dideoxygalactose transaminase|nr:DegT/DnrJ/EryC1/StrS family aminotransferase [Melioribacteraceae bacterium]